MTNSKELEPQLENEPISSFILTWDVIPLIQQLCGIKGWKMPSRNAFEMVKQELVGALTQTFGESKTIIIEADSINQQIENTILSLKKEQSLPVITMDPYYGASVADFALNTTRGITQEGTIEEIARPGYPDIPKQIAALARSLNGNREIYLIDAGVFTGGSLRTISNSLRAQNVEINTVILGFATKDGQQTILNMGFRPLAISDIGNPIDWIEARDFIPFVPLSGRVLKESVQPGQLSIALPYILPEGNPCEWASIPKEKTSLVSEAGWKASEIIFTDLQEQNGTTIQLSDFVDLPIRIGYPGEIIPSITNVLDVIKAKSELVNSLNTISRR